MGMGYERAGVGYGVGPWEHGVGPWGGLARVRIKGARASGLAMASHGGQGKASRSARTGRAEWQVGNEVRRSAPSGMGEAGTHMRTKQLVWLREDDTHADWDVNSYAIARSTTQGISSPKACTTT